MFRAEDLWIERKGVPPDLIVYFGNLAWRSHGSLGHGNIYTFENDTARMTQITRPMALRDGRS